MADFEKRLDEMFTRQQFIPVLDLHPLHRELLAITPSRDVSYADAMRIYAKFTWLNTYPRNYDDGVWESLELHYPKEPRPRLTDSDGLWEELGL